ncbi:21 kDa protein [Quillaja saponaria]|uniref:21 kDa protein n=1 Tax=Quillaja saponaria TaxID=32244 RepID=A0AAD7L192_QUISA|nr:21 kDa protein [Quillaja saponaria]
MPLYKFGPISSKLSQPISSTTTSQFAQLLSNPAEMAKYSLVFFLLSTLCVAGITNFASAAAASNLIKSSCSTTKYPALCVQSLSKYANTIQNPQQLAQTALSVSLDRAVSTKTFVTRLTKFKGLKAREHEAVKDCLDEVSDSVDRLTRSIQELKQCSSAKGQDFTWHISNVETWVSSALTDDTTCVDEFAGKALNGKIKGSIRPRMVNVGQVTSNALSLINKYASEH